MPTLTGLPGVRRKSIEAVWATTPNAFITALSANRAATDAGDSGSLTVYIDDKGAYRCYFSRWRTITNQATFTSKAAVRRWVKDMLPAVRNAA